MLQLKRITGSMRSSNYFFVAFFVALRAGACFSRAGFVASFGGAGSAFDAFCSSMDVSIHSIFLESSSKSLPGLPKASRRSFAGTATSFAGVRARQGMSESVFCGKRIWDPGDRGAS
jgi:hypothetical protein